MDDLKINLCRCHRVYGPAQFSVRRTVFRTQLPREYGPSKILYIQGIQSEGGGGLNSLIEWRFDFDDPVYSVHNEKEKSILTEIDMPGQKF